jgi:hypothetical protein
MIGMPIAGLGTAEYRNRGFERRFVGNFGYFTDRRRITMQSGGITTTWWATVNGSPVTIP